MGLFPTDAVDGQQVTNANGTTFEYDITDDTDTGEWVGSNFERKYLKENRPIFCLAVRKK